MGDWLRVDANLPCVICGKSDWCSRSRDGVFAVCRRVARADGRAKVDRGGGAYWVYQLGEVTRVDFARKPAPPIAVVDFATRAAVYEALLKMLTLTGGDRAALRGRGLDDRTITNNGYRSYPRANRARLVERLVRRFGEAALLAVPGVVGRDGARGRYLTLAGAEGVLVPVRAVGGQIVALKIRRRDDRPPKYTYLSSSERGGVGPGAPVHVPRAVTAPAAVVRLTEGELKADVACALDPGVATISIAGVGAWRPALPALRALGAGTCRLAFDADASRNMHVAAALKNLALQLMLEGFGLELETWDPCFKGIDDCLAAGWRPVLLEGSAAYGEAARLFDLARTGA